MKRSEQSHSTTMTKEMKMSTKLDAIKQRGFFGIPVGYLLTVLYSRSHWGGNLATSGHSIFCVLNCVFYA